MLLTCFATSPRADEARSTTLVRPPWKHNLGFNTLRQFHLTAYGGDDLVLADPRGIAAVKLLAGNAPGIHDDDEVTVLGVNGGRGEIIYNPSLVTLARFGAAHMPAPPLRDPVGVAVNESGLVAVGDRGNDRVVLLRFDDAVRLRYIKDITLADTELPLSRPSGVAINAGRVVVADTGNDRVVVVDTSGAVKRVIAGLEAPFDVDVLAGPVGNHYGDAVAAVTDQAGQRLSLIDLTGSDPARKSVHYAEIAGGNGGFGYVAIDYFGNVLVSDGATGCMFKFDRTLQFLDRFECNGTPGELDPPRGIAVNRGLGQVFIAESTGVSYYWVGTDIAGLRARIGRGGDPVDVDVRFVLTERSDVSVRLVSEHGGGNSAVELARDVRMAPGRKRLTYRVDRADLACPVADCTYRIEVDARATYASREHHHASRRAPLGASVQRGTDGQ